MRKATCGRVVFLRLICTGKDKETFLITHVLMYLPSDLEGVTSQMPDSLQAHNGIFICQVIYFSVVDTESHGLLNFI